MLTNRARMPDFPLSSALWTIETESLLAYHQESPWWQLWIGLCSTPCNYRHHPTRDIVFRLQKGSRTGNASVIDGLTYIHLQHWSTLGNTDSILALPFYLVTSHSCCWAWRPHFPGKGQWLCDLVRIVGVTALTLWIQALYTINAAP